MNRSPNDSLLLIRSLPDRIEQIRTQVTGKARAQKIAELRLLFLETYQKALGDMTALLLLSKMTVQQNPGSLRLVLDFFNQLNVISRHQDVKNLLLDQSIDSTTIGKMESLGHKALVTELLIQFNRHASQPQKIELLDTILQNPLLNPMMAIIGVPHFTSYLRQVAWAAYLILTPDGAIPTLINRLAERQTGETDGAVVQIAPNTHSVQLPLNPFTHPNREVLRAFEQLSTKHADTLAQGLLNPPPHASTPNELQLLVLHQLRARETRQLVDSLQAKARPAYFRRATEVTPETLIAQMNGHYWVTPNGTQRNYGFEWVYETALQVQTQLRGWSTNIFGSVTTRAYLYGLFPNGLAMPVPDGRGGHQADSVMIHFSNHLSIRKHIYNNGYLRLKETDPKAYRIMSLIHQMENAVARLTSETTVEAGEIFRLSPTIHHHQLLSPDNALSMNGKQYEMPWIHPVVVEVTPTTVTIHIHYYATSLPAAPLATKSFVVTPQ